MLLISFYLRINKSTHFSREKGHICLYVGVKLHFLPTLRAAPNGRTGSGSILHGPRIYFCSDPGILSVQTKKMFPYRPRFLPIRILES